MKERYERQILCPVWGENGQSHLSAAHAIIVGCGALGSVQAEVLARAGTGRISLIDRDFVEASNLHRQVLFSEADAAQSLPKAVAAARRLREVNSTIRVDPVTADLEPGNARDLLEGADLILDGTDNFETRYLINDFCVESHIPWIYGAAVGTAGLTMSVLPGDTACLRCVYPDPPSGAQPTCETAGVLASITMLIAGFQAAEALKYLSGNAGAMRRSILSLDTWSGAIRETATPARDPDCPACARGRLDWLNGLHRPPVSLCGRNAVQIHDQARRMDLKDLASRLATLGVVRSNEFALRFFRDPYELTVFPDGRAIVKGTTDLSVARSVYARYLGN